MKISVAHWWKAGLKIKKEIPTFRPLVLLVILDLHVALNRKTKGRNQETEGQKLA
jgi:hypothetical protein